MDKKGVIAAIITTITLILIMISIASSKQEPKNTSELDKHSWTKAICNGTNFCQDYEIECEGNKLIKISPLTGATIQNSKDWLDPRSFEQRTRVCD